MVTFCMAIDCWCRYIELDFQVSQDKRAVLALDGNLQLTGDLNIDVLGVISRICKT